MSHYEDAEHAAQVEPQVLDAQPHDDAFAEAHHGWNQPRYLLATSLGAASATFGDSGVVVATLADKIGAPGWLKVFPAVSAMTLSYVTVIFMGWWMTPEVSRKKAFFVTGTATFSMYLILAGALWMKLDDAQVARAMMAAVVCWSFADGFSMLPCWDLLARICSRPRRAALMSLAQAVTFIAMIVASWGVAWLVSAASPLKYPWNYALCVTMYSVGGIACVGTLLTCREYQPSGITKREPAGAYLRDLLSIVREDAAFRSVLAVACVGASLQTLTPVFLIYARTHRGFDDNDVSTLIAVKPWVYMAVSLGGVWLARRWGNLRMAMLPVAAVALGAAMAPFAQGRLQLAAQLLGGMSAMVYMFLILAVMHEAPPARNTRYMTVYFLAAILPGCFPLLLGHLVSDRPALVLGSILAAAAATLVMLARVEGRTRAVPAVNL